MSIRARFVRGLGPTSQIIAWAGGGDARRFGLSHVDICFPNGMLLGARSDAVGGVPPGVWCRPAGYEKVMGELVLELPTAAGQDGVFYDFLIHQIGKPYDKTAILGFIFGRDWREDDSWFCSELLMAGLEKAGVCERLALPVNKISPTTAAVVCSALGGVEQ